MVMVLFENERNAVQENALAFSTLGVDPMRLLSAEDLVPSLQNILERLVAPLPTGRAMIYVSERWRAILPSVQRGFSPELVSKMEKSGAGEYIAELAYRRGGFVTFHNFAEMSEPLPAFPGARFEQFRQVAAEENIRNITAVSLQTREHNFGVIIFPHAERRVFGSSNLRLLIGLALQIGLTLENYVVMHNAQRRTKEYELLTQIGQAISSRLDQDEILRTVYKELGQIFDTRDFYVAFQEGEQIRFEFEVEKGQVLPKRSRKVDNGLTEYILRTGQPLLIRADLEKARERLGTTYVPARPSKCFCGAPILQGGKPAGVMAVMSAEREYVFEQRDLEVMQTAAGQVSVAVENARLFAEEQRRSRQFGVSQQHLEDCHLQRRRGTDAAGDCRTHPEELSASITSASAFLTTFAKTSKSRRKPASPPKLWACASRWVWESWGGWREPGRARWCRPLAKTTCRECCRIRASVLCIPITYGETLLGVLNVESRQEDAFSPRRRAHHEYAGRPAGHGAAQFVRISEAATNRHHRRPYRHQDAPLFLGSSQFGVEAGFPLRTSIFGGADRPRQIQGSQRHAGTSRRRSGAGPRWPAAGAEMPAVECSGALRRRRIYHPHAGNRGGAGTGVWLSVCGSGFRPTPCCKSISSPAASEWPVFPCMASPRKKSFVSRTRECMSPNTRAAIGFRITDQSASSESGAVQRQLISGYIEGFLHREHTGPEHLEELLTTLKKLSSEEAEDEEDSVQILREAIEALTRAAELRELNGAGHGEMVARYSELMARALGLSPEEVDDLAYAARVHDVGKIFVPERVLNKSGPLTDEEFYLVKMHARVGGEIVGTLPASELLQKAVEHHHEVFRRDRIPGQPPGRADPSVGRGFWQSRMPTSI